MPRRMWLHAGGSGKLILRVLIVLMRLRISGSRRQDDGFAIARLVCLHACRDCYPSVMHLTLLFGLWGPGKIGSAAGSRL